MGRIAILLTVGLLALSACGDDGGGSGSPAASAPSDEAAMKKEAAKKQEEAAMQEEEAAKKDGAGTTVTLGDSEFGSMLFGPDDQAIYIFQNDPKGETVCYQECADGLATGLHGRQAHGWEGRSGRPARNGEAP